MECASPVLTSILAVAPVFALILSGFAAGRFRLLGPSGASELNKFVVFLALPALLFEVMARADWAVLWQPGFILAFGAGAFLVYGVALLALAWRGRRLAEASIDALNAGYANTGYIGFPICAAVFGEQSFALVTVATVMTASLMFAVAIVLIEVGVHEQAGFRHMAARVGGSLAKNPLIVAPVLGVGWASLHTALPEPVARYLHLLGGAASPCALASLGLFLAQRHKRTARRSGWSRRSPPSSSLGSQR